MVLIRGCLHYYVSREGGCEKEGGLTNNDRCEGGFARRISFGKSPIKRGGVGIYKF